MGKLDPIVSEFDTDEDAAAYDAWFRTQVQEALDSDEPLIPHKQVMSEMREMLDRKRNARRSLEG